MHCVAVFAGHRLGAPGTQVDDGRATIGQAAGRTRRQPCARSVRSAMRNQCIHHGKAPLSSGATCLSMGIIPAMRDMSLTLFSKIGGCRQPPDYRHDNTPGHVLGLQPAVLPVRGQGYLFARTSKCQPYFLRSFPAEMSASIRRMNSSTSCTPVSGRLKGSTSGFLRSCPSSS